MELTKIFELIKKSGLLLVVVSSISGFVTMSFVSSYYPHYEAKMDLYISKQPELSELGEYSYDGYYAQQVAEKYADTVVELVKSTEVLTRSIEGLELGAQSVREYQGVVTAQKVAPQLIVVAVSLRDSTEAVELVRSVADETQAQVLELNREGGQGVSINLVSDEPYIDYKEIPAGLSLLVGFMAGFGVMVVWILGREYLKKD